MPGPAAPGVSMCPASHPRAPVEAAFALALPRPRSLGTLPGPLLGVKASRSPCLLGTGLAAKGKAQLGLGCGQRWRDPGWTRHTPGPLGEAHVPPELCESEERKEPSQGTHFSRCRSYVAGGEEAMRVHGGQRPCTEWAPPPRAALVLTQRKICYKFAITAKAMSFLLRLSQSQLFVFMSPLCMLFVLDQTTLPLCCRKSMCGFEMKPSS